MGKKIILNAPSAKNKKVEIAVGNIESSISGLDSKYYYEKLDDTLSFFISGYEFSKAYRTGYYDYKNKTWVKWDGKKHLLKKDGVFSTGLLNRVISFFNSHKIDFEIKDNRVVPDETKPILIKNIQYRDYQDNVFNACMNDNTGIVKSATGSGKSIMIARLVAARNVPTIVYVTSIDLLYQMKESFDKFLGIECGIIGDGIADIKKINIATIWTASKALGKKYKRFDEDDFASKREKVNEKNNLKIKKAIAKAQMAIFDECHMVATETVQAINAKSASAYYKYGFSGTPERDDGQDLLLEAVVGNEIINVTASELIKDGWLVKPKIRFIEIPGIDLKSTDYQSIYREYIVENDIRNRVICDTANKLVKAGRKALILVRTIKHGEALLDELSGDLVVYFVRGELKSDERNMIRKDFIGGKIDIIIASSVYDQGVDLPSLDALILAGSGKSSGRALQRIGRVIRPHKGKKNAIVVDFLDNAKYLKNHSMIRRKIYARERLFEILLPKKADKNGTKKKVGKLQNKKMQW